MGRFLIMFIIMFGCTFPSFGQFHRINQVLQRGRNINAEVVPGALIMVCAPGATVSSCTIAPIYENISLTIPLRSLVIADASGNYDYYAASGCVDEVISSPGTTTRVVHNICSAGSSILSSGTAGTIKIGTVTTGAAGSAASVSNVGTASAAILNISIPQGLAGTNGTNGTAGAAGTNGTNGATPAFSIGTVTTGASGSQAAVMLGGTALAPVLNFSIPQGETGVSASGSGSFSTSTPETITAPWTFSAGIYGSSAQNAAIQLLQSGSGDQLPAYIAGTPTITMVGGVPGLLTSAQTSAGAPVANAIDPLATLSQIHTWMMQITGSGYLDVGATDFVSNLGVGGQYQGPQFHENAPDNGTIRHIEYAIFSPNGAISTNACTVAINDLTAGAVLAGSSTPLVVGGGVNYAVLSNVSIPVLKDHQLQVVITTPAGSNHQTVVSSTNIYVN